LYLLHSPARAWIYTLSLHDALPIWARSGASSGRSAINSIGNMKAAFLSQHHDPVGKVPYGREMNFRYRSDGTGGAISAGRRGTTDRKSTRLNSSHVSISYAVFCLKK